MSTATMTQAPGIKTALSAADELAQLRAQVAKLTETNARLTRSPWDDGDAFLKDAKEQKPEVLGALKIHPRKFSTGSYGWNSCGKVKLNVGGKECTVQVSLNMIVIGSKPANGVKF